MTKNYNDLGVEFKYLIVNDMDQKFGLWVNTVGFLSLSSRILLSLEGSPFWLLLLNAQKGTCLREYQLVYITKGRGHLPLRPLLRSKFVREGLWCCFPQWYIHTTHTSRQEE